MQRSVARHLSGCAKDLSEKVGELRLRHLAGGHRKLPVFDTSQAGYVPVDTNVVWRIGEDEVGAIGPQQPFVIFRRSGVAAKKSVVSEDPEIAETADDRAF